MSLIAFCTSLSSSSKFCSRFLFDLAFMIAFNPFLSIRRSFFSSVLIINQ
jgi:hypothetical protein